MNKRSLSGLRSAAAAVRSAALPAAKIRSSKLTAAVALVVLLIAGATGLWYWNKMGTQAKIDSIAVLPLLPLTEDENNKALGLGLADALIAKIGNLGTISVRPTSAIVAFADSPRDSLEFARKLKVDAILEGTIQQSEGRLRINARLLRTENGEQIWAEHFDQPMAELFALQDSISSKIAKTLAFELTAHENSILARHATTNPEAYEKFLRGRFYQSQNTPQGFEKSLALYEQAIAIDPNFADAHAGLADIYVLSFNFGWRQADAAIPIARKSVNRALELDPNLSSAYTTLSLIQFLFDRNWTTAERSLQKAIELNPNNSDAYLRYGYFLIHIGRFEDALTKLEKARELNPLSLIIQTNIGLAHLCARRFSQAIDALDRVVAENPDFALAHVFLSASFDGLQDGEKAFSHEMIALELGGNSGLSSRLRTVKETRGLTKAYEAWLSELLNEQKSKKISDLSLAFLYSTLQKKDETIKSLEKAYENGEPTLSQIRFSAKYDFIREDERFKSILRKIEYRTE